MSNKLLEYFSFDDMAASVWKGKYALENEETPDDMHRRLAKHLFRAELKYHGDSKLDNLSDYGKSRKDLSEEDIYNYLKDFKYIVPQGSIMSQLGADSIGSLSNCFVIGQPYDSYGGIMQKDEEQVQLMKRRGGVGQDLSTLRPVGTPTSNAAKSSTGLPSFMHRFSHSTREVAQNGRRGALMLSTNIKHPDALEFIKSKRDTTKITGANISIGLTDEFMEAVQVERDFIHTFPIDAPYKFNEEVLEYDLLQEHGIYDDKFDVVYTKKSKSADLWAEIIISAWQSAEPGLFFLDNHWNYSPDGVYHQFRGITTNPCGEIFMQPYDACRLVVINLFSFIINPFQEDAKFDFKAFYEVVYEAMRLSDDVVDLELEHIQRILDKIENDNEPEEIKRTERELWQKVMKTAKASRRTGLGFTALGDTGAALGFKYDSDKSKNFLEKMMKTKLRSELDSMTDMAISRGTFEGWDSSKEFYTDDEGKIFGTNGYYEMIARELPEQAERMMEFGRRNVSHSTLAPTGSTSMMTQTTSGIEPLFAPYYFRKKKVNPNDEGVRIDFTDANGDNWMEYPVLHPKFKDWLKGKVYQIEELAPSELQEYFEQSPWYGSVANDIDWIERVEIQSIIQRYTSHSISSTINLPKDVSKEEVGNIYMESWKRGLKGITVYREGSRDGVLTNESSKDEITKFGEHHAPTRPKYLDAKLVRFNNNKEKWIAFVGLMDDKPYEIFTGRIEDIKIPHKIEEGKIMKVKDEEGNKSYTFLHEEGEVEDIGRVFQQDYWNYGKLISGVLRHGMPLHFTVEMIKTMTFEEDHINTWKNGVARALKKFIPDGEAKGMKCHDCGSTNVIFEEGCSKCRDCGSSKCG